uniref:(northern house mosquito) hypothetical protein n=1 Tax=Culex pipiens TaxID=7175 RepID=A0A8D8JRJ4_CULPI
MQGGLQLEEGQKSQLICGVGLTGQKHRSRPEAGLVSLAAVSVAFTTSGELDQQGSRLHDAGGEHSVGRGVHPDVLGGGQVQLRRVQPAQVPDQLQQAAAPTRLVQQGHPAGRAGHPGGEQNRPDRGPDGVYGGGPTPGEGDFLRVFS